MILLPDFEISMLKSPRRHTLVLVLVFFLQTQSNSSKKSDTFAEGGRYMDNRVMVVFLCSSESITDSALVNILSERHTIHCFFYVDSDSPTSTT